MRKGIRRVVCALAGIAIAGVTTAAVLTFAQKRGWVEPDMAGGLATMRLISAQQYIAAVHDVFGEDIVVAVDAPTVQRRQGLSALGAVMAVVSPGAVDRYEATARRVAAQVVDQQHRRLLVPCEPASEQAPDAACAEAFFAHSGRHLFRRKLDDQQLQTYVVAAGGVTDRFDDFYRGLAYGLAGMLVSPQFLYFIDHTEPDPNRPGQLRLDGYSKAARLSLFLWNAPPDAALLAAAEAGELHQPRGLRRQVDRLLASPRLERGLRAFFSDMLYFDKFDTLSKDTSIYPAFTSIVARSAKEQALQLIVDQLLVRGGDYRELYTTPRTFADFALGPQYVVPIPSQQSWSAIELDPSSTAGLLTTLGFLAVNSHPGRSSPTLRGRAIRELVLCQHVPDPPPNVNFDGFQDASGQYKTARERLDAHATDPVCAGCHKITDPLGLAFEQFDGAGQFRLTENDAPIDPSGTLDGHAFTDVAGVGRAIHDHPALASCLASRLTAYGVARQMGAADRSWLSYIVKRFRVHDFRFPDMMREIATSRAFFAVSEDSP